MEFNYFFTNTFVDTSEPNKKELIKTYLENQNNYITIEPSIVKYADIFISPTTLKQSFLFQNESLSTFYVRQ